MRDLALLCLMSVPLAGQLTPEQRKEVTDGAIARLQEHYVFPDVADKMAQAVRANDAKGEYARISRPGEFATGLTDDFRAVSKDKHLRVNYSQRPQPAAAVSGPSQDEIAEFRKEAARDNFCFNKVERLAGNVGYLEFRCFQQPSLSAETVAAAFAFLANTEAIIIDVRQNGGGSPDGVALICSYLFDEPVHLNSIYNRKADTTRQYWTVPVTGRKFVNKDVYVLTSSRTFSGAEEFSYNLKNLKRARIIGEVTGGGAHPVRFQRINDHFGIGVPFARAINPITKTNWEGTGVEPDERVPAPRALKIAHIEAIKKISRASGPR